MCARLIDTEQKHTKCSIDVGWCVDCMIGRQKEACAAYTSCYQPTSFSPSILYGAIYNIPPQLVKLPMNEIHVFIFKGPELSWAVYKM